MRMYTCLSTTLRLRQILRVSPVPLGSPALPLAILRLPLVTRRDASFARVRRGAGQADVLEGGARCVVNIAIKTYAGRVVEHHGAPACPQ